jgi:hypothetical protein
MNEFDHRWKIAAAAARPTSEDPPEAAPFGFATRVVARWKSAPSLPSPQTLWLRFGWRALGGVTALLLAIMIAGSAFSPPDDPLTPSVSDTVSELFWLP